MLLLQFEQSLNGIQQILLQEGRVTLVVNFKLAKFDAEWLRPPSAILQVVRSLLATRVLISV